MGMLRVLRTLFQLTVPWQW